MGDDVLDRQEEREYKRQKAIEKVVEYADRVILETGDSEEEQNYLTAAIALKMMEKTFIPFISKLARLEMDIRHKERTEGP